ncbi:hypothetical protein ABT88_11955 [Salmonella enterica subsp. enterica serovar Typhimurium]|nr:hypothetical protein ABT88_11955 [Salmonella enterica subsp. enterica serovar Typhimurium]
MRISGITQQFEGCDLPPWDMAGPTLFGPVKMMKTAERAGLVGGCPLVVLTQGHALVSFAYNLGARTLSSSTLLRKLNAGDYAGAADEFLRWKDNKAGKVERAYRRRRRCCS